MTLSNAGWRMPRNKWNTASFTVSDAAPSLALSFGLYQHQHINDLTASYTMKDWPVIPVKMADWWLDDGEIPSSRTSLFGFPSQRINVQWIGGLEEIRSTLSSEGWAIPPARDWISTLHRVADISSTQYLPMISPQYQDKKPALIMTKNVAGLKNLMVIRLWDSSRVIAENKLPLWVGTLGVVPRTYSWVYKKQRIPAPEIQPDLVFSTKADQQWSHKIVDVVVNNGSKKQKILLIRPY